MRMGASSAHARFYGGFGLQLEENITERFTRLAGAHTRPLFSSSLSRFCYEIHPVCPQIPPNFP